MHTHEFVVIGCSQVAVVISVLNDIIFINENRLGASCSLTTVCTFCAVLLSRRGKRESSVLSGTANYFLLFWVSSLNCFNLGLGLRLGVLRMMRT
jgi:hypothetical protein